MKICPLGAVLFHMDGQTNGQTDMMKLMVAFYNFENAHKTLTL